MLIQLEEKRPRMENIVKEQMRMVLIWKEIGMIIGKKDSIRVQHILVHTLLVKKKQK